MIGYFQNNTALIYVAPPRLIKQGGRPVSLSNCFTGATALSTNTGLSGWNITNVGDTSLMFNNARNFNDDISGWNISNITNFTGMFWGAKNFDQDLSSWDLTGKTTTGIVRDTKIAGTAKEPHGI